MHLQLRMSLALNRGKAKEVMAVLTGDSNINPDSNTSFIEIIEMALSKGWDVEVYAVKGCLSEKIMLLYWRSMGVRCNLTI